MGDDYYRIGRSFRQYYSRCALVPDSHPLVRFLRHTLQSYLLWISTDRLLKSMCQSGNIQFLYIHRIHELLDRVPLDLPRAAGNEERGEKQSDDKSLYFHNVVLSLESA